LYRAVQYGILEQPSIPFSSGEVKNQIPEIPKDLALGREDLWAGCKEGIYEEVATGEAERIRSAGASISASFVVWQDRPDFHRNLRLGFINGNAKNAVMHLLSVIKPSILKSLIESK
jgi:hypothetical protein